jgi:uncharacterized repeat protein (TIGR01451 family)
MPDWRGSRQFYRQISPWNPLFAATAMLPFVFFADTPTMTRTLVLSIACATAALAQAQFGPYTPFAPHYNACGQNLVMDLDSDGDQDVLLVSTGYTLTWLDNDGSGGLSMEQPFTLGGGQRVNQHVCAADLDGDTDMDLVAAPDGDSTRWFRNNGTLDFEPMPAFVAANLYMLAYGEAFDVDLDGDQDLLVVGNAFETYLVRNLDGLGTFAAPVLITSAIAGIEDFDMADFDADGDLDLLVSSRFFTFAVLNSMENTDGQGSFGNLLNIGTGTDLISQFCCALLDMDGDGDRDAVINANTVPGGDLCYYPNTDGQGTWGTIVTTGLNSGQMGQWTIMDFDNDGDKDLVGAGWGAKWIEQTGLGTFAYHGGPQLPSYFDRATVGDIDGDGDDDVFATSSTGRCVAWTDRQGANFGAWTILEYEPMDLTDMCTADVDGDGDQDALVAARNNDFVGWYPNSDGFGTFGAVQTISYLADSALAMDAGDVDGDGDMDVVVAEGAGQLTWFENISGAGDSWQEHEFATGLLQPTLLKLSDLDGNGDADVIFCTAGDGLVRFCLNNNGVFSAPQAVGDPLFTPVSLEVADLNGDPWPDVIVSGNTTSPSIKWFQGQPGGTSFTLAPALPSASSYTVCVRATDLDGDGDNDLLYCHEGTGKVSWTANDGAGAFSAAMDISTGLSIKRAEAVDLTSDGILDVLCLRTVNGGSVWLPGLGDGLFATATTVPSQMYQGLDILTADVDGDLDADVLQCNNSTVCAWLENHFGSPFRIGGTVYLDLDSDGAYSAGDELAPYVPVSTTPYVMTPYTEPSGDYLLLLDSGAYTVTAPLVGPCWSLTTDSAAYHELLTSQQPAVTGRDFGYGITCATTSVSLTQACTVICGSYMSVHLHALNNGTTHPQGTLQVVLDPLVNFTGSTPPPTQQDGDTLWYDQAAFGFFEEHDIVLHMIPPGASFVGDTMHFAAHFSAEDDGGNDLGQFSTSWEQVVECAYDPNAKSVEPAGLGEDGIIPNTTERLTYTIHFQNTGTDTATSVTLYDQLSSLLDRGSIQVLGYTHPFDLRVEADGEAIFTFNNIMLPDSGADFDGSQGHVIFSIALQAGLPGGTIVENSASIVFDLNVPVITNTMVNTLFDCGLFVPQFTDLGGGLLQASSGAQYQWYLNGEAITGATGGELLAEETGLYSVQVTNAEGCMATTEEQLVVIEGVPARGLQAMSVLPNPATGDMRLICAEVLCANDHVELTDVNGRTLRILNGKGSREVIIERGSLPGGIYTLNVLRAGIPAGSLRVVMD